jgi:hypothetical protein
MGGWILWSRVISLRSQEEEEGEGSPREDEEEDDDLHLVPFVDFANHEEMATIRWRATREGIEVLRVGDWDDVPAGTEVHLSYGKKPNSELL